MLFFSGINWLAVAVAFVIFFAVGAIWFGPKTFYPVWIRLAGLTPEPGKGLGHHSMPFVLGLTALGALAQVVTVAWIINIVEAAAGPATPVDGLLVGLLLGIGIAAASSLSHRLFSGHGVRVWLIEVGSDVVSLALAGLVIGLFN